MANVPGGDFTYIAGLNSISGVGDFIASFDCTEFSYFILQLEGTFTATFQVQFSTDGGTIYNPMLATTAGSTNGLSANLTTASTFIVPKGGGLCKVRCTAFTSNASLIGNLLCCTGTLPLNVLGVIQTGNWNTGQTSPFPNGATSVTGASGNVAAAAANAQLGAVAAKSTYLTGFEVTGAGATAGSVILVTVTGVITGTLTYNLVIPAGATTSITPLIVEFSLPIISSAVNTAIAVNVPSFGAGNTNAATVVHGYNL